MTEADRIFTDALAALAGDSPPRVWSLLVTAFGDLAQEDDARLSGTLLTRLLGLLDVRPEAMRTALHRLRRDGWLDAERSGREGWYALSATGLAQSRAASPLIYGPAPVLPEDWHVLIAGTGEGEGRIALATLALAEGIVSLGDCAALAPGPAPGDMPELLAFDVTPTRAPDWLAQALCPADLRAAAATLDRAATRLRRVLSERPGLSPLQVATLRLMVVHAWRRVALRIPKVPAAFLPGDWSGDACRASVKGALDALPRPPLKALEEAARA